MSRVYTENVLLDVATGTAAYITAFHSALASTRIDIAITPGFGGSLLDFLLGFFGSSDPWSIEESAITFSWANWDKWRSVDSQLHIIPLEFKASWPPPQEWVTTIDWKPLQQENPRRRKFGRYRTRK